MDLPINVVTSGWCSGEDACNTHNRRKNGRKNHLGTVHRQFKTDPLAGLYQIKSGLCILVLK